jgi:hypothetical protein
MPDTDTIQPPVDSAIQAAKQKHGDLVVIDIEGKTLAFRRLDRAKLTDMKRNISKNPDLSLDVSVNTCEFCCVVGQQYFKELSNKYPLAFCGTEGQPGVIDVLMDLARGGVTGPSIRVE